MGCSSSRPKTHDVFDVKKKPFPEAPCHDSTSASSGESWSPRQGLPTMRSKSSPSGRSRERSKSMIVVSRSERSCAHETKFHSQRLPPINETRSQSFSRTATADLLPRQQSISLRQTRLSSPAYSVRINVSSNIVR